MSRHPIQIDVVTTPTSVNGSCANINGEVRYLPGCAALSSNPLTDVQVYHMPPYLPIPLNHDMSNGSGTLLSVTGVPVAGLPLAYPSKSTPPRSTARLLPASGISNGNFSNNVHSFTHVDTASNLPMALILPGTLHTPPPVKSRAKIKSHDRPHQYKKSRKKGEVQSLHWSRRSADIHKARIPQFSCDDCGAKYVQQQGLNRHHREKHQPSLCMFCDAEWGRPYEYREHLEKHHPDIDPDMVLGKVAGSRRWSACFARHRPQQVSLPTIEHGRRGHSGIRRYPPAVVKPSIVTLPPPDMTYIPQPESTQPIMASKNIPEGTVNLDCFLPLILITLFPSIGEHARTTWTALRGALQDGYPGHPSNPVMTFITALNPTVDRYLDSPNLNLRT